MNSESGQMSSFAAQRWHTWVWKRLQFSENGALMVIAVVVGLLGGLAAVGFHQIILLTGRFVGRWVGYFEQLGAGWLLTILAPAIGAAVAGGIVWLLARHDHSHGTAAVMEAVALRGGRLSARPILAKVVGAGVLIGSGGSAGPEDPSVQVGSVIGSWVGGRLKLSDSRVKVLVAAGVASAIAAAFNAPIAGVFFALEVVACEFSAQLVAPVVLASVAGSIVGRALLGAQAAFAVPAYALLNPLVEIPLYAVLGLVAACVGSLLIVSIFTSEKWFAAAGLPKPAIAALGGALVGMIALVAPEVGGVGYEAAELLLNGVVEGAGILLFAKFIATSITIGSAGIGGTFAPSLVIGAAVGGVFGQAVNHLLPGHTAPAAAYALVGMGAVLAAVIRAPITAVLLLFEVTGDYHIILPIMASVVVSTMFAHRLHTESIYTERLVRKGIQLRFGRDVNILEVVSVGEVMTRNPETVPLNLPIGALTRLFHETHHHGLPVVDADGRLVGIVTLTDLSRAADRKIPEDASIDRICSKSLVVAHPDQSLNDALRLLATSDVGRLPVVDRQDPSRLLGVLRRNDVIKAYKQMAMHRHDLDYRLQQMRAGSHSGGHLITFEVPPEGYLDGRMIRDLRLPREAIITGIQRDDGSIVPRGDVILRAGDILTVLTPAEHVGATEKALREGTSTSAALLFREATIGAGSPLANRRVAQLELPPGVMIVALLRQEVVHTVNGQTVLQPGDKVTLVAPGSMLKQIDTLIN